jgi:hypothetical protein
MFSVFVTIGTNPEITFFANVDTATSATLTGYFVGSDLMPDPASGSVLLQADGRALVIALDQALPFTIGGPECTFQTYTGAFTQTIISP